MERAILHSDLNCFYASVEMMLDPRLRGKAVAVCGCTEDRHGIVLAKSEKAKRAGVKTGMVNWEAQRCCKDLIIVPPQYDQYLKYSKLTQAIYQRYLGVSRDTVLAWIEKRNMPAAKIGRLWKFKVSEVDAWMKSGVAADK